MSAKLYFFFLFLRFVLATAQALIIAKPGCQDKCGEVSIPYPFGIGRNCFMNIWSEVKCDTRFNPPKVFLAHSTPHEVVGLSVQMFYTTVRVKHNVSRICSDGSGAITSNHDSFLSVYKDTPFTLSRENNFTVIGCNMYGVFNGVLRSETIFDSV
ncbi:hypothetical protein ACHQM5_019045 [Ranunculus cassubicifolius]